MSQQVFPGPIGWNVLLAPDFSTNHQVDSDVGDAPRHFVCSFMFTHWIVSHRIGWWKIFQETPKFDGKNYGFRLRFPFKPIQWVSLIQPHKPNSATHRVFGSGFLHLSQNGSLPEWSGLRCNFLQGSSWKTLVFIFFNDGKMGILGIQFVHGDMGIYHYP